MNKIPKFTFVALGAVVATLGAIPAAALGSLEAAIGLLAVGLAGAIVLIVFADRRRAKELNAVTRGQRALNLALTESAPHIAALDGRYQEMAAAVKRVDDRTDQMQRRIMATLEISRLEAADRVRDLNQKASH